MSYVHGFSHQDESLIRQFSDLFMRLRRYYYAKCSPFEKNLNVLSEIWEDQLVYVLFTSEHKGN